MTSATGTSQLKAYLETDVLVEYGHFALEILRSDHVLPEPGAQDGLLRTGPGGALFASTASDHYAHVRLEYWTAPPSGVPTPDSETVTTATAVADFGRHDARIIAITAGPAEGEIALDHPGPYVITAARTLLPAAAVGEPHRTCATFPSGIEAWTIRLWPVAA